MTPNQALRQDQDTIFVYPHPDDAREAYRLTYRRNSDTVHYLSASRCELVGTQGNSVHFVADNTPMHHLYTQMTPVYLIDAHNHAPDSLWADLAEYL